ncbi:hypothetical protein T01_6756 [Trichinella spiralis]|uniref:Uncharacterized protein n=1 Tax=Trichinella spiralis TaxID=6334 RepID=A0A0V0Z7B7_TRISP|nr:hypothetical protein T01_6756 [Trichinella spiralis]
MANSYASGYAACQLNSTFRFHMRHTYSKKLSNATFQT